MSSFLPQDFIYPHAKDRQFLHYFYRKSKKQRFNVERYNKLKDDLAEVFKCSPSIMMQLLA